MNSFSPPRPYQSTQDLESMRQLLRDGLHARIPFFYAHPGDLDWWLFYPPLGVNLIEHIRVWGDPSQPGSILGWALADPSWPSFEIFIHPNLYASLEAAEMITWAEEWGSQHAKSGADALHKLWVAENDDFQRWHLEDRGFHASAWDMDFLCDLESTLPETELPAGYSLRLCRGLPEVKARAIAQYGAFNSKAPFDTYIERFRRFMQSDAYTRALDVVAVDPEDRITVFCIAWPDADTGIGHFEPVGTHPDFQRKGLGRAIMAEALRLLRQCGMHYASVCTPESNTGATAFYKSLGFQPVNRLATYEKVINKIGSET